MREENANIKLFMVLGGIGVVIQLLFLHWSGFRGEENTTSFVNNYYVTGIACLFGGLLYALFLRYPVTRSIRERRISLFALCTGALGGGMATALAFQGRYLLAACFLTHTMKSGVPGSSVRMDFPLALLSIEIYALIELVYITIPALFCGALVTMLVGRAFIQSPRVRPIQASPN